MGACPFRVKSKIWRSEAPRALHRSGGPRRSSERMTDPVSEKVVGAVRAALVPEEGWCQMEMKWRKSGFRGFRSCGPS